MTRTCLDCPKQIDRRSLGRCRSCARAATNRSPEGRETARRLMIRLNADPEFNRGRGGGRKSWCPPEFRKLNDNMRKSGFPVTERKRMIAEQAAVDARRAQAVL